MGTIFEPPLIGPFVEKNGLIEKPYIGAAITWTSAGEIYRWDIIHTNDSHFRQSYFGFAQTSELDFNEFLWQCFEHSSRLPDFLNELQPFIRPSGGAPTPARAGEWLNPNLVGAGFSLGIAKIRGNKIRVPVVWAFGGNSLRYGSRTAYSRIDFIDWSPPNESILLRRYDHWGIGARALKRLLFKLVDADNQPLLTEKGNARMRQLLEWARPNAKPIKQIVLLSVNDKAGASDLRKSLKNLAAPLLPHLEAQINQLSEKSYAGVIRTCVTQGFEQTACVLLSHRSLPQISQQNLLERFIDRRWLKVWKFCLKEAQLHFSNSASFGYNKFLSRVLETGNPQLLCVTLNVLSCISSQVASHLLERALEVNREDLVQTIVSAPVIKPVLEKCLLQCFAYSFYGHNQSHAISLRLLDLGARPLKAIKASKDVGPSWWLLDNKNLPIFRRALEIEPVNEETITILLNSVHTEPGETFNLLCSLSRNLPDHEARMIRVAFHCAVSFIRGGSKAAITMLEQAFAEGASLSKVPATQFAGAKLLTGYGWREDEGNWIDLMAHLIKIGRKEDAEVLKKLKRPVKKIKPSREKRAILTDAQPATESH